MKIKPTRRLFLKGVGGYMLSLPILECMLNDNGNAYAQGGAIEPNYLYTFQGESSGQPKGTDGKPYTLLYKPPQYGNLKNAYNSNPNHWGNGGLKTLAEKNLLDDINVISNLYINSNKSGTPGNIHVIGNTHKYPPIVHRSSNYCVNSGYGHPNNTDLISHLRYGIKNSHSTDQAFYDKIGQAGKHLNICIEKYEDGWDQSTSMRSGYIQTPEKNVSKLFETLFGGFNPPKDSTITVDEYQANRRSVLNLVLEDHKRLKKHLGYNDRIIVDQHLSSISDLEKDIKVMEVETLKCELPAKLSESIPINSRKYGGEKERAIMFNKMIALAMACGISRSGQYTILRHKAWVDPTDFVSSKWHAKIKGNHKLDDLHEVGHHSHIDGLEVWREMCWWISSVYGDLVQRFKDIPVGGGNLLDQTFIMMGMHQGVGKSLEGSGDNHVHSYENMCYLQAGGKYFGARTGQHIDGARKHPVAVANKAMELANINLTFGDIKDKVNIG